MRKLFLFCSLFLFFLLLMPHVQAHYNVFGELRNANNHEYFYYSPTSGGSAIPSTWRGQIGLAVGSWNAQSSNVNLKVTVSEVDSRFYVANSVSGIADCLIFGGSSGQPHHYWYIRYSANEKFSTSGSNDYNVNTVALHELGHALGLDHVGSFLSLPDTRAHIMYYTYTTHKSLHDHDIEGLRSIYGN